MIGAAGALFRLGASMGPEDDIDKAAETALGYWLLGASLVLILIAVLLWRAGSRRRRAAGLRP